VYRLSGSDRRRLPGSDERDPAPIAYVTWMNAFLNFSFLMMVGTVIINLAVGALDQQGRSELAHRVDRLCRWRFPLSYFGLILFAFGVAFLVF
jgi:hypothetical protein